MVLCGTTTVTWFSKLWWWPLLWMAKNCYMEPCKILYSYIIVGWNYFNLILTRLIDVPITTLHVLWSHLVQDFAKLKKLWKSSIYDMHLQVLWRSRNKTLLSIFPPTVQRIRCFNLLDENTVFSLAVNVWCVSTSTEPGSPSSAGSFQKDSSASI